MGTVREAFNREPVVWILLALALTFIFMCAVADHAKATPSPGPNTYVVAFGAKWCEQCALDKPKLDYIRSKGVTVYYVDADEKPEIADQYGVKDLPTYVVMHRKCPRCPMEKITETGTISILLETLRITLKIIF